MRGVVLRAVTWTVLALATIANIASHGHPVDIVIGWVGGVLSVLIVLDVIRLRRELGEADDE